MKIIKYFFEFIIIISLFCIFKIIGLRNASNLGSILGRLIGPLFRSKDKIVNSSKIFTESVIGKIVSTEANLKIKSSGDNTNKNIKKNLYCNCSFRTN